MNRELNVSSTIHCADTTKKADYVRHLLQQNLDVVVLSSVKKVGSGGVKRQLLVNRARVPTCTSEKQWQILGRCSHLAMQHVLYSPALIEGY
jgi:hypothetical protein